jgi:hypothetical protein
MRRVGYWLPGQPGAPSPHPDSRRACFTPYTLHVISFTLARSTLPRRCAPFRVRPLPKDGGSAVWDVASASLTHIWPAPDRTAAPGGGPVPLPLPAAQGYAAGAGPPPILSLAAASNQPPSLAAARAAVGGGPGIAEDGRGLQDLFAVCSLGGFNLYGTWDADVNGFWHPAMAAGSAQLSGAAEAGEGLSPVLRLADCRSSAAIHSRLVAQAAPSAAAAAAAQMSAALPAAVSVPLADWPVCVACLPDTGDVVMGSLRGQLSYWWKA